MIPSPFSPPHRGRPPALAVALLSLGALGWPSLTSAEVDPFAGRTVVLDAQELRGLPGEVAALLLRAEPGGDLTFEVNAVALPGQGGKALVPIFVEIDGAALLDRGQGAIGRVEVYAYAIEATGKIGDFLVQAFTLDAEKLGEVLWQSGPRFQGNLQLPPGEYRLRILVRESHSKAAGLRELPIVIGPSGSAEPSPSASPPASPSASLGPALFEEPRERDSWIPVRAAAPPPEGLLEESVAELESRWQRGATPYGLISGGRALVPAALPVLGSGSSLRVYLPTAGLPEGRGEALFLQGEKELAKVGLEPAETEDEASATLRAFTLDPPNLPPGRYSLTVRFGGILSPPRDVLLVAREARDGELLWSDLRWRLHDAVPNQEKLAGGGLPSPAASPGDNARLADLRVRVGDVAARYKELLEALPGQPRPVNVARLLELEARILEGDASEAMTILQNAEIRVAHELADWDPEAMLPVIQLHYESYLAYRQRRIFALLTHSRILIDRLVGVYVDKGKTEGARRLAALVLGGLGLEAEEGNLSASSRRLYQRALGLDPGCRQALLGLATSEERQSHRDVALELLRQLAEQHPDFSEGLLRLGVNERYARRDPRAHLAKARSLPGPAWVGRLAGEELARLDLTDPAGPAAELLAGTPALAGEISTVALLAHLEDRRGRFARSLELARIAPLTTTESARRRYDQVPREERQAALEAIAAAAEIRRPLLEEWAAGKAAKGGKKS